MSTVRLCVSIGLILSLPFYSISQTLPDSITSKIATTAGDINLDSALNVAKRYSAKNPETAQAILKYAIDQSTNSSPALSSIHTLLGTLLFEDGKTDSATHYLSKGLDIANRLNYTKGIATAKYEYGRLYTRLGKSPLALEFLNSALNFYELAEDSLGIADTYNALGAVYRDKSDYHLANEMFFKSLKVLDQLSAWSKQMLVLNNISMIHVRQRDYKSASIYTKKALKIFEKLPDDSVRMIGIYNSLGLIYNDLNKYDSSVYYHNEAIKIAKKYNEKLSEAIAMQNIANAQRKYGDYALALSTAEQALQIKESLNNKKSILFTKLLIADIYCNWNKPKLGIPIAKAALKEAKENGFTDRERVALLYLSQCYDSLNDYKTAYSYHKRYTTLQDSIFDATKAKQIDELQTQYETAQKEEYIAKQEALLINERLKSEMQRSNMVILVVALVALLLISFFIYRGYKLQRSNNKLLHEKNLEIAARDKEKAILLKEIHHRVKNNLQVISSILNIQSRHLADDSAKKAVSEGRSRIKSMSLIHEKLYSNDQLSVINMKDYIEELTSYLFSSYKPASQVSKNIDSDNIELDIDTAIPLGLILNELISNSLKYAFKEADGLLEVKLKQFEGEYELSVKDTGQGINVDFEKVKSMGLRLVNTLSKQLDAALEIKNEGGANISLRFKPKNAVNLG